MRTVLESIESELHRYKRLGEKAIAQVDAGALARRPPGEGNSVATLVWHIAGNLRSRFTDFLISDGEKPWRDRDSEFVDREVTPDALLAKWEDGWGSVLSAVAALTDDDLARTVRIRGEELRVLDALQRSLAHTSYHVGQIVFLAKLLSGGQWQWLSIPPGQSEAFNRRMKGQ